MPGDEHNIGMHSLAFSCSGFAFNCSGFVLELQLLLFIPSRDCDLASCQLEHLPGQMQVRMLPLLLVNCLLELDLRYILVNDIVSTILRDAFI